MWQLAEKLAHPWATPIKRLDPDDRNGQLEMAAGCICILVVHYTVLKRRHHSIAHLGEEASFYLQLGSGEPINYLNKKEHFLYTFCPKLGWLLAGVPFYFPCSTWWAGHLDQVWCGVDWCGLSLNQGLSLL